MKYQGNTNQVLPEVGDVISADTPVATFTGRVTSRNAGQITLRTLDNLNPCRIEVATITNWRLH